MKNGKVVTGLLTMACLALIVCIYLLSKPAKGVVPVVNFTNVEVLNASKEDSVKVWLTVQSPNSVVGVFGIEAEDTVGSCSKGCFWAKKGVSYYSNVSGAWLGVVISFVGDNDPCQVAVTKGFKTGINIFECSLNTPFEVFDISCEDGVNSIVKASVSDSLNWSTGDGVNQEVFLSAENKFPIESNLNIRGVFPYRCTDCIRLGQAVPENCFNLKDTCNVVRICQTARTNHVGGVVKVSYLGPAWEIAK